jgi:superfamily II DNA helicase RecQ
VAQDDSHQSQLDAAASGLLSLEDVLLPAIARHETNALKQIQAKAQRDASDDVVEAIKQCRVAICDCTESAIRAVRQARLEREALHSKHLEELAQEREMQREKRRLEREEELERRRQERAKAREEERERKRREMKKTLPKNVELWKEVAFLMTELAKMSKEEKLWQEIDKKLDEKAKEIETTKNEIQNKAPVPDADESDKIDEEYQERVDNAVEDINLSALRIQRALQLVSEAVAEADGVRSDLFQKYIHDHQFHGYAGVNDPKALIRMLSQD